MGGPAVLSAPLDVLRPDPAVQWEVDHDIVRGDFGIAASKVEVEVRDGVVSLHGEVERRGQVAALVRRVQAVDGVVEVDGRFGWRIDGQVTTARPVT